MMITEATGEPERAIRTARPVMTPMLALLSAFVLPVFILGGGNPPNTQERSDTSALLAAVVAEVKELGRHPGEDFYRWEFFLGEDDDDTNKDIHAVVLIHEGPPPLRLRVHITDLERLPANPRVRIARQTRAIFAAFVGGRMAVEKSDYPEKELVPVLRSLVKAIRDKKRLLREADERRPFNDSSLIFGDTKRYEAGRNIADSKFPYRPARTREAARIMQSIFCSP